MVLGSTQPLREMTIINFSGCKIRQRAGLTTLQPYMIRMSENMEASSSRTPKGLHDLYRDNFTFT
jgi:hypothetical protein